MNDGRSCAWLRLALSLLLFACSRPAPSTSEPQGGLGVAQERGAAPPSGPLTVTYFSPSGDTDGRVEVSVAFDRPMIALGDGDDAGDLLHIEPPVRGSLRWAGSQTLLFEPAERLPMATEYRVRLAPELKALDGNSLVEEFTSSFTTQAPALVRSAPSDGARREGRTRAFDLFFNQRITPAQLCAHASVEALTANGGRKPVEVACERPDPGDLARVRVAPVRPYPMAAQIVLTLRAGLRGDEGPRPLAQDVVTSFHVYGPLRLVESSCPRVEECEAKLVFSNPVHVGRALAALRFEPPLARPLAQDADYESDTLYFGSALAPATDYRVRVEGVLRDVYGNALEGPRSATVRTPPLPSAAHLTVHGEIFPTGSAPMVRARLQNVRNARLELARLKFEEVSPLRVEATRPREKGVAHALGDASGTERRVAEVDGSELLPGGRGVLLATLTARGAYGELAQRRLLAFTDLAATLKVSDRAGIVLATRLSDAAPVARAKVRILSGDGVLARGETDTEGVFRFALPAAKGEEDEYRDVAAVVEKDGDIGFARKYDGVGPWQLTDNASTLSEGPDVAYLFTDRGIYRPGDELSIKGILRTEGQGSYLPSEGNVVVAALDANERELDRRELPLSGYGTFAHKLRIPASVPLGPLSLRVQHRGRTFSAYAEVAEYQPVELEAEIASERERYVRGETARARVDARFLFGAPAREGRVVWTARSSEREFAPKGFSGFVFRDETLSERERELFALGGDTTLDSEGQATFEVPLAEVPSAGPSYLELEATAMASGADVSTRTRVELTPAELLVGVRASGSVVESGKPIELELAAVLPDGKVRAGSDLDARLIHRTFVSEMVEGRLVHSARQQTVGRCRVKSARDPAVCEFTPKLPGLYVAEVRGRDRRGRESRAATYVYAYGSGQAAWADSDGPTIALKSERTAYALGETARILVPSPFAEAEALVTVERDRVLSVERVRLASASTLDVKIDERFVPNAFVSVLLLRPGSGTEGPDYRIGAIELAADASQHRLAVRVEPDATVKRPGDELRVKVAVHDRSGAPAASELTIFAVDEGVLALTAYRTPDPFAAIYARRPLAIWSADSRANLGRASSEDGEDEKGGDDGAGGGQLLRQNFAALAYFAPDVETDASGRAEVRFKLPDATTRYRIMAVAASRGSALGSGEAAVRTVKPLFVRPLLPRVLRAGDAFVTTASVHNEGEQRLDVDVRLEAKGVELLEPAQQRVAVEANRAAEVRIRARAPAVGEAHLTFHASGGGERDAIAMRRAVLSPAHVETVSIASSSGATIVKEALAPLSGVRSDVGGLELTLSGSALAELEAPARALFGYEYGCSEQLASRLIALAALERLRVPLGLGASYADQAPALLGELERHQRPDGSFGMWRADERVDDDLAAFLTAYATIAFDELGRAGIAASPHVVARSKEYLAGALRRKGAVERERAFALYALARAGAFDASYAGTLIDRESELAPTAQLELGLALASGGADAKAIDARVAALSPRIRVTADEAHVESNAHDDHAPRFVSDVRATAELLLLLLERGGDHALVPKLARWLAAARDRDGTWTTTQATAWALMAMATYSERREQGGGPLRAQASLAGRELGRAELADARAKATFAVPMRELPQSGAGIEIEKRAGGLLHYIARLSYARRELPSRAGERGFFVERTYEHVDPGELARGGAFAKVEGPVARGEYVRVTLRVVAPSARRFVLIVDPIPAGLTPLDTALATAATTVDESVRRSGPYDHRELRDDRAVFAVNDLQPGVHRYSYLARAAIAGTFVAPPTRVEEMYHPETHGFTAASTLEVAP